MTEQEEECFKVFRRVALDRITLTDFIKWVEEEKLKSYTNGYVTGLQNVS